MNFGKMFGLIVIILYLCEPSLCVIYQLNQTQYDLMPALNKMEDYYDCIKVNTNNYCTVRFTLVSDQPSDLLFMIQEYSLKYTTHFNHTNLLYGVCVKEKCQSYNGNKSLVSEEHLETCLNETLWKEYKLRTKVNTVTCNNLNDDNIHIDASDIAVGVVVLLCLLLNVIGTVYDIFSSKEKKQGQRLLCCFSVKQNWLQLCSTTAHFGDEMKQFRAMYGIRTLVIISIILGHVTWPFTLLTDNSQIIEEGYNNPVQKIIFSGGLLVQIYFVMTGFLLAYKLQKLFERTSVSWSYIPKTVFFRWLRLSPPYFLLIALMGTWFRFLKFGPLWGETAAPEVADCRKRWWLHVFYLNNYYYESNCMPHAWYLAADIQLWVFGLIVCLLIKGSKHKKWILGALITIGIVAISVHTYVQDLEAMLILFPTGCREFFATNPTFNETYKKGHTNLVSFAIGLANGYLVYDWQTRDVLISKYKKYQLLHWFIIPVGAGLMMVGTLFYRDAPRDPIYIRTLFAALSRPFMGFLTAAFILGMIFRIDNYRQNIKEETSQIPKKERKFKKQDLLRLIMEWKGWILPGRLSYCVYLIHFPLLRIYAGTRVALIYTTPLSMFLAIVIEILISFIMAVPLSVLVEIPFLRLIKEFSSKKEAKNDTAVAAVYNTHL